MFPLCEPVLSAQYSISKAIDFSQESFFFATVSTAGDGEFPVATRPFVHALSSLPIGSHLQACVLALGDSAYPRFCEAGKTLAGQLEKQVRYMQYWVP
jgi:sulfite reductase (NADPH) flavoprotein alpha-component